MKIELGTFGSRLKALVCTATMANPLPISIKGMVLPVMLYSASLKIKKDGFGLVVGWDSFAMMGNPFSVLQRMDLGSDLSNILNTCPETLHNDTLVISRQRPMATG